VTDGRAVRVLVVDDSVPVRRLIRTALESDPEIQVVGSVGSGQGALERIEGLGPDVVTLDIEMPDIDGLQALSLIKARWPRLAVIMLSTTTERGAAATLDALTRGASDYVPKPAGLGSVDKGIDYLRQHLIPRVKTFGRRAATDARQAAAPPRSARVTGNVPIPAALRGSGPIAAAPVPIPTRGSGPVAVAPVPFADIVAIGVSTGGPAALARLLPQLPADFPVPILVAQHIPPVFSTLLAQRLDAVAAVAVEEATNGRWPERGAAYIAPGDHHLVVEGLSLASRLAINQAPRENSCRPSVDVLFRSVAVSFGARALAVVLTGMGQDGLKGCEAIRQAGGQVIVQDEASSVVWGMPGFVAKAGLADGVYALDAMAGAIAARVRRPAAPAGAWKRSNT
jgi:two-component system chemotaxis response regulator CheB